VETERPTSVYEQGPVRLGPRGSGGRPGLLAGLVAIAVLIAIAKPWTLGGSGAEPVEVATTPPTSAPPSPGSDTQALGFSSLAYDPKIFGFREPAATWGIWPAGFLITFGFVIEVPDVPAAASQQPAFGPGPRASHPAASPTGLGDESTIAWPAGFEVPDGNHLLLIGINMPLGHSVQGTVLSRLDATGTMVPVALERLQSPWPTHFVVVALAGGADGLLRIWPAGRYRLDVTFGPEGVTRSIEIVIAPPR
jgi:hypothetical protein